jgi:hypothetical protein
VRGCGGRGGDENDPSTIDTAAVGQGKTWLLLQGLAGDEAFLLSLSAELPVGLSHRSDGVFWLIAMGPPASSLSSSSSSCADDVGGGDIDSGVLVALRKGGDTFGAVWGWRRR